MSCRDRNFRFRWDEPVCEGMRFVDNDPSRPRRKISDHVMVAWVV